MKKLFVVALLIIPMALLQTAQAGVPTLNMAKVIKSFNKAITQAKTQVKELKIKKHKLIKSEKEK